MTLFNHLAQRGQVRGQPSNRQLYIPIDEQPNEQDTFGYELGALYVQQAASQPYLSESEEKELLKKAQKGDKEARDKIVVSMLRLVNRIARRYAKSNVLYLDLVEEGNFGLFKAIEKFNFNKGCRFATYAAWWVQDYIERYILNCGKTVRVPAHILKLQKKIHRQYQEDFGIHDKKINITDIAKNLRIKESDVKKALDSQETEYSLEQNFVDGLEHKTFLLKIEEGHEQDLSSHLIAGDVLSELYNLVNELPEKYYDVVVRRYGILGFSPMTLSETSKDLSLTVETVRSRQAYSVKLLAQKQNKISSQRSA